VKGCVQLGMAPALDFDIEMTPVDYVASALVAISLGKRTFGDTYHLINPRKLPFLGLVEGLRRHGWPLRVVPVRQWWQALQDGYAVRTNELHPVMTVVEEFVVGGEEAIEYHTGNADRALRGHDIVCPPLDDRLLDTYLGWMRSSGYLPPPEPDRDA
jgi:thioester reductase-like protein